MHRSETGPEPGMRLKGFVFVLPDELFGAAAGAAVSWITRSSGDGVETNTSGVLASISSIRGEGVGVTSDAGREN